VPRPIARKRSEKTKNIKRRREETIRNPLVLKKTTGGTIRIAIENRREKRNREKGPNPKAEIELETSEKKLKSKNRKRRKDRDSLHQTKPKLRTNKGFVK
jgi:hypothetical protein